MNIGDFGVKTSNFGLKNGRSWGLLAPIHGPTIIGFFKAFLGLGKGDFRGFLLPIDICRAKVRFVGVNL